MWSGFVTVVVEQFLDEVDVSEQHATTAVSSQTQRIQRVHLTVVRRQQIDVLLPNWTTDEQWKVTANRAGQ